MCCLPKIVARDLAELSDHRKKQMKKNKAKKMKIFVSGYPLLENSI